MGSHAWAARLNPGCEEEYLQRHQAIWPELVSVMKEAGITSYAIFRNGLDVFGYFETVDIERTTRVLGASKVRARWGEFMAPLMHIAIDPETNYPAGLEKQWEMN